MCLSLYTKGVAVVVITYRHAWLDYIQLYKLFNYLLRVLVHHYITTHKTKNKIIIIKTFKFSLCLFLPCTQDTNTIIRYDYWYNVDNFLLLFSLVISNTSITNNFLWFQINKVYVVSWTFIAHQVRYDIHMYIYE